MRARANMLRKTRDFFHTRGVIEVDTNILSTFAPVDAHIDIMRVDMRENKTGYLHSSPEYEMKKLLAGGSGDIYQLGHVFRAEEQEGPWHSLEFTMLEWYRVGMAYEDLISETLDLIELFLPGLPHQILTYRRAFRMFSQIDYVTDDLTPHVVSLSKDAITWDRDTQLSLLFSHLIEPHLGKELLTVITNYPSSQAALAKTVIEDGLPVARRFEVYYRGIELANGFDELLDAKEQRKRLENANKKRVSLGKNPLPIDEDFLAALEKGLPECCGVAVGFDRLMKLKKIEESHLLKIPYATSNLGQLETAGQH